MSDYQGVIHKEIGGMRQVIPSGGSLDVESGGEIDIEAGGRLEIAGTAVTSSAAELNILDGVTANKDELNILDGKSAAGVDGLGFLQVARATYDFAEHGGAISAINLGVTIPDNAIVVGGFVEVLTTCTTAGADAGTMALSVEGAGDIVAAIAVSDGTNPWDAGKHAIVPKANTPETTGVKLSANRAVTATIAGQAFTAGKFIVYLYYVQGD